MNIPTIAELEESIANDLRSKLNLSDDELKETVSVISSVLAGQFKLAYLTISDAYENVFPDKADSAENGGTLDRHGLIHLNRLRKQATSGVYRISARVQLGSNLRSGLTFKSNDDSKSPGKLFVLDNQLFVDENDVVESQPDYEIVNFEIRALAGGLDNLLSIDDNLTITEPISGVFKQVTVIEVIESPVEAESEENYRDAIIESIQLEPQGGSKTDYRLWARDAQGVASVYPYVKENEAGVVQVYVEANVNDSQDGNGTPTAEILAEVDEVLQFNPDATVPVEGRGRRPIQALLEIIPITPIPVDITIYGMSENTPLIISSLQSNIGDFISKIRPFVAGGDILRNKNDVLYSARIQSVITDVIGSFNSFNNIIIYVDDGEQVSFLFEKGDIPYLRNLIFEE